MVHFNAPNIRPVEAFAEGSGEVEIQWLVTLKAQRRFRRVEIPELDKHLRRAQPGWNVPTGQFAKGLVNTRVHIQRISAEFAGRANAY